MVVKECVRVGKGERLAGCFFFFHMRDQLLTFSPFVGELNSLDVLDLHTLELISTSKSDYLLLDILSGQI